MKIVVCADNTGFAPRDERFTAYDDDSYEPGMPLGKGATPTEAIADLLEILEAEGEITVDELTMLMAAHGTSRNLDPDRRREDQEDRRECLRGLEDL